MEGTTVIVVWILACAAFMVVLARWFLREKESDYFIREDYTIRDFYTRKRK